MIVEDNAKNGLKSITSDSDPEVSREIKAQRRQGYAYDSRPRSVPDRPTSEGSKPSQSPISRYSSPQSSTKMVSSTLQQHRPVVQPKPKGLRIHPKPLNGSPVSIPGNKLEERFSQLRVQPKTVVPWAEAEPRKSVNDQYVDMPSPIQYIPPSSNGSPSRVYQTTLEQGNLPQVGRPAGPREMPPPPPYPPPPPKIPLDARQEVPLPRAPSPAYNPAKSAAKSPNTHPHLHRKRSIIGTDTGQRSSSPEAEAFQRSSKPNGSPPLIKSANVNGGSILAYSLSGGDHDTTISVTELCNRLQECDVLLIDVRTREEYDQGHIFANSIMCIEPLELRSGVSAEELEERLVVSPSAELALFEKRNRFDLIVYYDQRTSSNEFLTGPPNSNRAPALRALYDTLYEFNAYKPLRRPPAMLIGGLDAWINSFGHQALQISSTAILTGLSRKQTLAPKPGRPIGRVPMASSNSNLEIRKRRLREYQPLNADEEKTWREKAREEEVESEYRTAHSDSDIEPANTQIAESISPLVHSYEDFLRRFPEPSAIRQSMMISAPPPPIRPTPVLPEVPSRPPPAVPRPSYGGVLERDSSPLSPSSRQPLGAQPPLYTSRAISHYLKLPRTGLINFSVTCYLNATIQCLLATIPLSQFFLDKKWRDHVQKNWKGSNGIMPEIYANLIRSLWRNDVQAVRPSSLRNFCARLNPEWGIDRQQDAKEYLDFLLDCLHEDLNFHWQQTPLRPLTAKEELVRERMPVYKVSSIEWDRYLHRESSFISKLFAGQHASQLRCTTCKHTSTTYEAFYSISVEIPRSGRGDIHECLRSYCQEEMLSGEEVWKCPHCQCEREATKQIILTRAPQFLVVHFKRFSASKTESARKVHTPIEFPLRALNIEPYMVHGGSSGRNISQELSATGDAIDPAITPPFLYDAYAVMRHIGQSGGGGHYISLVRDAARGCWRKFDDERVTDFDPNKLKPENRLQNEQAYLVFYGRAAAR